MVKIKIEELVKLKEEGLTDNAIAEYFTSQGIKISRSSVTNRLNEYYKAQGREKPRTIEKPKGRPRSIINIEEVIQLREKGLTYKEIEEVFTSKGIKISGDTIARKLNEYYKSQGNVKTENNIVDIEELVRLKEQELTDKAISEHLEKQGINIKPNTVSKRLIRYYKEQGIEKPKIIRRISKELDIEELVKLKEQGLIYEEIVEYLNSQGIIVSKATIVKRVNEYYKTKGTKTINVANIEELIKLKEQGLSDEEISMYLAKEGKRVKPSMIRNRINEYYKTKGIKKPRIKKKQIKGIDIDQIIKLKKEGLSNDAIAEYLTSQGIKVSSSTIRLRLKEYCDAKGIEIPNAKTIDIEEAVRLKELGLTDKEVTEQLKKQGVKTNTNYVKKAINEAYKAKGKVKPRGKKNERKYKDELKEILMKGMSIEEYISESGEEVKKEDIELKLKKLRVVAEHAEKRNGEWIPDSDFIEVLDTLENPIEGLKRYTQILEWYFPNRIFHKGKIDAVIEEVFRGNADEMSYVLSRLNIRYNKGYHFKNFHIIKEQYEKKIDRYLARLREIEKGRSTDRTNSDFGNNTNIEEEER